MCDWSKDTHAKWRSQDFNPKVSGSRTSYPEGVCDRVKPGGIVKCECWARHRVGRGGQRDCLQGETFCLSAQVRQSDVGIGWAEVWQGDGDGGEKGPRTFSP